MRKTELKKVDSLKIEFKENYGEIKKFELEIFFHASTVLFFNWFSYLSSFCQSSKFKMQQKKSTPKIFFHIKRNF